MSAKSLIKSVFILCLIALLPNLASGTRKYVPDDYPTIQQAINGINSVDSIIVRPGFYQENLVITNKVVKLFSEYIFTNDTATINQTIIDGTQANRVIYVNNNNFQLCIINGFTIQNGRNSWGGGIMCWENSTVRIENCHVQDNVSTDIAGGIATAGHSQVTISHCEIMNNSATGDGGGVEVGNFSKTSVSDCIISGNHGGYGGGIYNCTMPQALDYKYGLSVNRCVIANNSADAGGGFCNFYFPNEAKIVNSTFYNNQANESPEIYVHGSSSTRIVNTIIFNDSALVRNVIGMPGWWGAMIQFDYCLIYGGLSTIDLADTNNVIYSSTNLDTVPFFVDALSGNFNLESYSPCIDAAIDNLILPPHIVQPGEEIWICIGEVQQIAPEGYELAGDILVNILPDQYYGSMPDIGMYEYFPPISVKEIQVNKSLLIYPNPTRDKMTIQLLDEAEKSFWSIIDLRGNVIFHGGIANTNPLINLDLSGLSSGLYFLKKGDEVYKIVKY